MRKKIIVGTILLVGVISAVIFVRSDLHRVYLPTASGIMAKQVCSLHFVSGFSHEEARTLYLDPLADDFAGLIFSDIRVSNREVYASIIGLYRQTAVFREGIGCSLVHDGRNFDRTLALPPARDHKPLSIDYFHRASHFDTLALESALNTNFIQSNRNTLAIVVLNKGHLIAERYADGITPATPLHGWSMAKSLTATLAGAMVHRGEIELDEKGIVNNSRLHELTLDHLLRMNTGLDITETSDGWDPNSKMLFTQADMADWASHRDMLHKPGEKWEYMSGNTILAMRAMQNRLGETLDEQLAGLRERVFEPLDIYSAIFETDEAGTLQGSSYMYATAHDWARLGQLYLNRGMAGNERILPENWMDIVTTPTPGSGQGYGLGFWLGRPGAGAPADGFYMSGFQGQVVYIFPDQELVIVRLGATNFTNPGGYTLAADVLDALIY